MMPIVIFAAQAAAPAPVAMAPPPAPRVLVAPPPVVYAPPPVPPPGQPQPLNRYGWITDSDYPAEARKAGWGGNVAYALDVGADGAVTACRITAGSGHDLLDAATCKALMARARFLPAHDGAGKAMAATWSGRVRWFLPDLTASPVTALPYRNPFARQAYTSPYSARRLSPGLTLAPAYRLATTNFDNPPAPPVDVAWNAAPPADPAVHYGRLANGLRYAVMAKPTRVGGVAIRLSLAAGSLDESDDQRGYAHLMEHMAFRGSANVPDGEFVKRLEAMGMSLGQDTTAFTMQENTLYGLDFPYSATTGGASPTRIGFGLLREVMERATISPAALAAEKGVVAAEERVRDDPNQREEIARVGFLLAGQPVVSRWSIGTREAIAAATPESLRAFYEAHYRPENVFLVVVGNIDAAVVEGEIKSAFGDWQGKGVAPPPTDQGRVRARGAQQHIEVAPGAPPLAQLNWVDDFDASPDTLTRERQIVADNLASNILNTRLARLSEAADAPFINASVGRGPLFHSATVTGLSLLPKPGQTEAAMAAVLFEARRLARYGVSQEELARAIAASRDVVARNASGAKSRDIAGIAAEILSGFQYHRVVTTPDQTALDVTKIFAALSVEEVSAAGARIFAGAGPLAFVSVPAAPAGGEAALAAALDAAAHAPLSPPVAAAAWQWPYTSFGPDGAITSRQFIADLGVTMVRFANGTSLTIKYTPEPKDQILVRLGFGRGLAGVPKGLERSYWQLSSGLQPFLLGGLGKGTVADISSAFAGHRVGTGFGLNEGRFSIGGETDNADLATELQLLTAYVADPAFRPAAFERARSLEQSAVAAADATASAAAARDAGVLLSGGDRRWQQIPGAAELAASQPEDLAAILRPALAGPLNLAIVGDVPTERAITLARATIGALPPRGPALATPPELFPPVPAAPVVVAEHGRADDAMALTAWPVPGFYANMADARAMQVLAALVQDRLQEGLRGKDGATYSPSVNALQSTVFADYGRFEVSVELNPDKVGLFNATLSTIVAEIARNGVTSDEFERARAPLLDEAKKRLRLTEYWLDELVDADVEPDEFETIRSRLPQLAAMTPADMQRLVSKYLAGRRPYRAVFKAAPAIP